MSIAHGIFLAQEQTQTVLEKLEPERRIAVVLALIGLALLGVLLVVVAMLASRWARHDRPGRSGRISSKPSSSRLNLDASRTDNRVEPIVDTRDDTIVERPGEGETEA